MVRIYVDADTVVVLDRMNKRFVKESLVDLKDNYPFGFDYNTLESLLTNRLFTTNANRFPSKTFPDSTFPTPKTFANYKRMMPFPD